MEYPDIHFKQELLFVAELEGEGEYLTYSTYQTYNVLQQDRLRVPVITVSYILPVDSFSKTCVNGHSQKDWKFVFKTKYRLMQVKSIAFCNAFDLH